MEPNEESCPPPAIHVLAQPFQRLAGVVGDLGVFGVGQAAQRSAARQRISNFTCAPTSAVMPAASKGGNTSTTSPPTISRPRPKMKRCRKGAPPKSRRQPPSHGPGKLVAYDADRTPVADAFLQGKQAQPVSSKARRMLALILVEGLARRKAATMPRAARFPPLAGGSLPAALPATARLVPPPQPPEAPGLPADKSPAGCSRPFWPAR